MDNSLDQLSHFFLEPVKRQQCRPGGLKILSDMKKNTSKPQPHTHQNKLSEDSTCSGKSQNAQNAVVNKQKQATRPSSTSLDSDSVKSLILKLNAAKQNQGKARTKAMPPHVPNNKISVVSEEGVSLNSTSILEQMFMSSKTLDLGHKQRNSIQVPNVTAKSAIKVSNKGAPSNTKPSPVSNSKEPPKIKTQAQPLAESQQTSAESCVTPKILNTTSPGVTTSLEEWFLSKNTVPMPPVVSWRRSAEEARSTIEVPSLSSNVAESSGSGMHLQIPSPDKPGKSLPTGESGSEAPSSEPLSKEPPPSPIMLTIRRLGTMDNKDVAPKHRLIEQGRPVQLPLQGNKTSQNSKSIEPKAKRNCHSEHSENERSSERYQPSRKSKRIPFRSASNNTNVDNAEALGDNLQSGKPVRQTPKQKKKPGRPKKNSGSSVLSKKQVLNKHSRSTQKTKQNRKKGLENMEGHLNKTPVKRSQRDTDPALKSTKKKTFNSSKNSNSHSQRLGKSTKKGTSKTSRATKRAASSKDSDSESRKRLRKSSTKSNKVVSDEDDSKLEKSRSSGGTIFTLSELEHACNTLLPVSEIQQLEDRLHSAPIKSTRVPVSHSGLGSIFDTRIHPGGIWKSIVDEG